MNLARLSALCLVAVVAALAPRWRLDAQPSRTALASGTIAITNVAVVPMTSDTVIRDATVIVRDGRIAALGPAATTPVPNAARRIDGKGKYLIPGLADMHTHLYSDDDSTLRRAAPDELGVSVANGVTTLRLMIGTPEQLVLRREIEAGRMLGPQLWLASPQFTGRKDTNARVVTTPEEARAAVKEVADAGYDFVKLTLAISPPVFEAIVSEAARNGIRVVGHVDPRVGVMRSVAAGQHIEHLDNYLESILSDTAPTRNSVSDRGVFTLKNWESIDYVDESKIAQIAGATARARVWTTPTLTLFKTAFGIGQTDAEIRARREWNIMPADVRTLYLGAHERYWKNPASESRRKRWVEIRNRLTKAILDSGGRILAGSDAPEWFLGYGFTLHRELENLVGAGLTPYQALVAATRNPAEFLHATAEWGTIEPGKRADLVLLSANPLSDIRNTTRIEAVTLGGRWLPRAELDRMIRTASQRINGGTGT